VLSYKLLFVFFDKFGTSASSKFALSHIVQERTITLFFQYPSVVSTIVGHGRMPFKAIEQHKSFGLPCFYKEFNHAQP
jgi:hypothetical protein